MYQAFASAYDALMDDVDYDAWCSHYLRLFELAGRSHPKTLAELCCGTGQFALRLAAKGIRVTGIDGSREMLAVARENARKKGFNALPFVCADAARFELHRPVDAILCACDGVNYLASPLAAQSFFRRAYEQLNAGGVLAFDVSTPYKLASVLDGRFFGEDRDDVSYLWSNRFDPQTALCHMDLTLFFRETDGRYVKAKEHHVQRAHSIAELSDWLSKAGFEEIRVYTGRYEDAPPLLTDERIHVTARRVAK